MLKIAGQKISQFFDFVFSGILFLGLHSFDRCSEFGRDSPFRSLPHTFRAHGISDVDSHCSRISAISPLGWCKEGEGAGRLIFST
jgi:hypothetical protein